MLFDKKPGKGFSGDRLHFIILILVTGRSGKLLQNCGVLWDTIWKLLVQGPQLLQWQYQNDKMEKTLSLV
jgi:hypothetical protein